MKNVLFVASECYPFIKTGGLADVVGALPKMFNKNEFDVRVVIPKYMCIPWEYRQKFKYVTSFYMDLGKLPQHIYVGIMMYEHEGIKYYFIDNEHYFGGDKPYGNIRQDVEKFCFFDKAVLAMLPVINFKPDIIHCHDWQTGLVPVYLRTLFSSNGFFWGTKTIMTIHNLKFQGIWNINMFKYYTGLPDYVFSPSNMEYKRDGNMLKGGIVFADYVTTVSDSYAGEIQMPYYGEGLDGLIRKKNYALCGIVNGIDYNVYNPEHDIQIYEHYTPDNFKENKVKNKRGLQKELGLPIDDGKFMIGIISRLTDQKGIDLVNWVMERIVDPNTQFVVIGTGDDKYENLFRHYEWKYKDRVSANIFYSDNRAHKLYAAADAMLMPSRFEPCGLTQLISLRYGTVPIVRETGGLRDTVQPYNWYEQSGTGFTFKNYNAEEMLAAINYAKTVYFTERDKWNGIVWRGMKQDFSWGKSAGRYAELYYRLTR
ncbi:MAG: glycogen/starch synthase [Clostridia bacterium]|nr:glycogen/starch synthase [Clostridia bacterium]